MRGGHGGGGHHGRDRRDNDKPRADDGNKKQEKRERRQGSGSLKKQRKEQGSTSGATTSSRPTTSSHPQPDHHGREQQPHRPLGKTSTPSSHKHAEQHQHQSSSRSTAKRYVCPFPECCRKFSLKTNLARHTKETHPQKASKLTCETCSEEFTRKASLHRHAERRSHCQPGMQLPAPTGPLASTAAAPPTVELADTPMPPEPQVELLPPGTPPTPPLTSTGHPKTGGKSIKLLRQLQAEMAPVSSSTESEEVGDRLEVTTTIRVYKGTILHHQEQAVQEFNL